MHAPSFHRHSVHLLTSGLLFASLFALSPWADAAGREDKEAMARKLRDRLARQHAAAKPSAPSGVAKDVPVTVWPAPRERPMPWIWLGEPELPPGPAPALAETRATPFQAKARLGSTPVRTTPFSERLPADAGAAERFRGELDCPPPNPERMGKPETGYRTLVGDDVWVKGYRIQPGSQLQGADLRATDLRGLDLRGMGLECADLEDAQCKGARFQGARLFAAHARGVTGMNLTGAMIHPFFQAAADEPLGTVKFLHLPEDEASAGGPHSIVVSTDGSCFWLEPGSSAIHCMTAYGTAGGFGIETLHGQPLEQPIVALTKDAKDNFWLFSDRFYGKTPMDKIWGNQREMRFGAISPYLSDLPATLCSTPAGEVLIGHGDNLTYSENVGTCQIDPESKARTDTPKLLLITGPRRSGAGPENIVVTLFPVP